MKVLLLNEGDDIEKKQARILLTQLSYLWKFRYYFESMPEGVNPDVVLSVKSTSQNENQYYFRKPIWQLGIVSDYEYFRHFEEIIFFKQGNGHFGFDNLTSLRIDDYPLTSEKYLKSSKFISDNEIKKEIHNIQKSCLDKAKPEYMISSHIMEPSGKIVPITEKVPESLRYLNQLYKQEKININAHGRSHIDEKKYLAEKTISPFEFSFITAEETREHFEENIKFIKDYFGKLPQGFVAPCWGYNLGVTKRVAGEFFSYVADSNQNLEDGMAEFFGHVDKNGVVHLPETVRATSKIVNLSEFVIWRTHFSSGLPIHFMAHGPILHDPMDWMYKRKKEIVPLVLCYFLLAVFIVLNSPLPYKALTLFVLCFAGVFGLIFRKSIIDRLRYQMLRLPCFTKYSLRSVVEAGINSNANWVFLEDMAKIARAYSQLNVTENGCDGSKYWVEFDVGEDIPEGIAYFAPCRVIHARLDKGEILRTEGNRILFNEIKKGNHFIDYATD